MGVWGCRVDSSRVQGFRGLGVPGILGSRAGGASGVLELRGFGVLGFRAHRAHKV